MLVASLFAAASATAENYALSLGVWGRGDGFEVDVPFLGKTLDNCAFLKFGLNYTRMTGSFLTKAIGKEPKDFKGFMTHQALPYGCPSGMGAMIVAAKGTGASFTLPPKVLSRPGLGYLVAFPLPLNPNLVQAATSGLWRIPYTTRGGMGTQGGKGDRIGSLTVGGQRIGGTMRTKGGVMSPACTDAGGGMQCANLAPFRKFLKSAWKGGPASTFNSQTGRAGADFTWCGGVGPCTTFQPGAGKGLMVRYKAGPNKFGGTSNQIVTTGINQGSLFIDIIARVVVNILDAGKGAIQVEGRGYADRLTDNLPPGMTIFAMVMTAPVYQKALHRPADPPGSPKLPLITAVTGPGVPTSKSPFAAPAQNIKFGFPLTTGTVIVRDTNNPALGPPVATLTAMGGDTTTAMGARNISLVTGTLATLTSLGVRTAGISQMFLPEPSRTGQLLAGVAALFVVAAWRARRART